MADSNDVNMERQQQQQTSSSDMQDAPTTGESAVHSLQMSPTQSWLWSHFPASPSSPSLNTNLDDPSTSLTPPPLPGPSAALRSVFANHTPDPTAVIAGMVRKMSAKILPGSGPSTAAAAAPTDLRSLMAMKLYYAMLENIVSTETQRITKQHEMLQAQRMTSVPPQPPLPPPVIQFNSWLGSRTFHASLLSVAFEVVLYAHASPDVVARAALHSPPEFSQAPHYLFPYSIQALDLSSWDFLKHLEWAVRHLPSMLPGGKGSSSSPPPLLKQYLKRLENECLLWRIWVKDSPLLRLLDHERASSMAAAQKAAAAATASTNTEEKSASPPPPATTTPAAASVPSASPSSSSALSSATGGSQNKILDIFQRQLFSLAAEHLSILCGPSGLNLGNLLLEGCWELLKEIVIEHTNLLHNRHLDSLILCIVYNVAVKIAPPAFAEAGVSPAAAGVQTGIVHGLTGQGSGLSTTPATPAPLDFKKIIAAYMSRWEYNHAQVIREVSTFHASSQPLQPAAATSQQPASAPTATTTLPQPGALVASASIASTQSTVELTPPSPAAPVADEDVKINLINFYNKFFISEIKQYSMDTIKPKLMDALDQLKPMQQRKAATATSTATTTAGKTVLGSPLPLAPSTPYRGSHSSGSALLSPGAYSPLRGARDFSHRSHPYHLTPHHSNVAGGSIVYPAGSIHAYLSPRKAQVASSNIYMSRLPPTPSTAPPSAATLALPRPPVSSGSGSGGNPNNVSYTPTKGKLGLGLGLGAISGVGVRSVGVAERMATTASKEEEAMAALSSMPATPLPHPPSSVLHSGATLHASRYNSASSVSSNGPLTPLTISMYAFGESPSSVLDDINRLVAASASASGSTHTQAHSTQQLPIVGTESSVSLGSFASPAGRPSSFRPTAGGSGTSAGGGSGRKAALRRDLFSAAT